jgi:hypothetical protein
MHGFLFPETTLANGIAKTGTKYRSAIRNKMIFVDILCPEWLFGCDLSLN